MAKKQRGTKKEFEAAPTPRLPLDRILIYSIAFTLFAIPLFIWPGLSEYGYGKTMVTLIAVSVLSILWGLSVWQKRGWSLRIPWIASPFLGFVIASLLSLLTAINGRVVVQSLVLVVFFFQLALIIANVVREKRDATLLLSSVVASAFFASVYGLLQYLGAMPGAPDAAGATRIISTMGNKNFLGGFLSYLLLPSFVLLLRPRSRILRAVALGVIAFNFGTLMLVDQLAPMVGLIVAGIALIVGLILFRPVEPIRRNRAWLIGLLVLLVLTFLIEAPSGPLNSVVGLSQDGSTWVGRLWDRNSGRTRELDYWVGFEMLKGRPITGVGLGNYKLAFLQYKATFLATPRGSAYSDLRVARAAQAHNDFVQVAAELGGLGILAMLGGFTVLALSIWRRIRRNPDEADRLDLLLFTAGLIVFLVHALVSFPAHLPTSMLMIILLLGLIHAPAYGDVCVVTARVGKKVAMAIFGLVAAFAVIVSGFAISDLSANVLMSKGIEELQVGDSWKAVRILEKSIAYDFAPRQTYYMLATAQVKSGEIQGAIENFEKCFTRFVDENLYVVYGELMLSLDRLEEAREAIAFLLSTHPQREIELRARYTEATIAVRLRDYSGASRRLKDLVEDAPDYELALIALGNIYQAQQLSGLAIEYYERALTLIDGKLAKIETEMIGRTEFTAVEYGEYRQSIESLQGERAFVVEQLEELHEE